MKRDILFKIIVFLAIISMVLTACSSTSSTNSQKPSDTKAKNAENINTEVQVDAPFDGWVEGLPKITAPEGFDWKQFEGVELNVITENTPPSSALAANINLFEDVTGIKVNIEQSDLGTVVEKTSLDFNAKSAKYHVIYADPYQILAKHSQHFVDLNAFIDEKTMPAIPGGLEDFIPSQLEVNGYMGDTEALYALPYDNPTMVLAYRKDVFEKYKHEFMADKGFDWTPGPNLTWEQYYEAAKWITEKAAAGEITEVKYGAGHQAKQHDSLMNDYSNILAGYGGDYFEDTELGAVGKSNPGKSAMTSDAAKKSAELYKKIIDVSAPGSTSWDWSGLGEGFAAGDIAMAPEWHEFSSMFENPDSSKVVGKVSWASLPKGDVRQAHSYGGTGIGINKYGTDEEKKAAWLFLVWATSPQAQYMILKSEVGGSTPTRHSVYDIEEVQKGMQAGTEESKQMPNLLPMKVTLEAWKEENVYMRPKVPQWPQIDTFIFTELSKMLADQQTPEETVEEIAKQSDQATGN
ncbi:extracellular solute-binding protein [Metabacillus litoralis]|uniref:ABC transporter substrate-binding protein n=1 Tax=Metabacillus litoralis TaxID=152268 RepID=A0A179SMK6_9BACI|nr:extracellular solute-binding protein [Metabacillus litoralis]OAS82604.1 ABC transporter substrate-binding protein [Metabacillus litoralis]